MKTKTDSKRLKVNKRLLNINEELHKYIIEEILRTIY